MGSLTNINVVSYVSDRSLMSILHSNKYRAASYCWFLTAACKLIREKDCVGQELVYYNEVVDTKDLNNANVPIGVVISALVQVCFRF